MAGEQVATERATPDLPAHIKPGPEIPLAGAGDDPPARGTVWSDRDP